MCMQWPLILIKIQLPGHGAGVEADKLMCAIACAFIIMPINMHSSLPLIAKALLILLSAHILMRGILCDVGQHSYI